MVWGIGMRTNLKWKHDTAEGSPLLGGELAKGLRGDDPAHTLVFNPFMHGEAKI